MLIPVWADDGLWLSFAFEWSHRDNVVQQILNVTPNSRVMVCSLCKLDVCICAYLHAGIFLACTLQLWLRHRQWLKEAWWAGDPPLLPASQLSSICGGTFWPFSSSLSLVGWGSVRGECSNITTLHLPPLPNSFKCIWDQIACRLGRLSDSDEQKQRQPREII